MNKIVFGETPVESPNKSVPPERTVAPVDVSARGDDLAAQFQRCATRDEVEALSNNPAVKRQLAKWSPDLRQQVKDAAAARYGELEPAKEGVG